MRRFFAGGVDGDTAFITGDDVHHIRRVLRMQAGEALTVCDGCGTDYDAVIESILDDRVRCRLTAARPSPAEPHCHLTLFQALPKGGKLETILQKCTELGVAGMTVFSSKRCDVQAGPDFEKKRTRLRRVALEAAKQSGRGRIPDVQGVIRLSDIRPTDFDLALLAYEAEKTRRLKDALRAHAGAGRIAIIVGPEGGFEDKEAALMADRGAIPVSLGPRILRTETAGAAMCAQILYEVEM